MSRNGSLPSYQKHTSSGQAVVTLSDPAGKRKDYYLGTYGSADSKAEYARLIAEWTAAGKCIPHSGPPLTDLTVNELLVRFWAYATEHYRYPDGQPTSEQDNYRFSLRPLKLLYGHTLVREFGPLALKAIRQAMIDDGLTRRVINQRIGRVKRVFKWGVAEELVEPRIYQGLSAVTGLGQGRSKATDRAPIEPVDDELVKRTLCHLNRFVSGMVRFQRLTGCRPQDVCNLRRGDIDTTGQVWLFCPRQHKTAWRGKRRMVAIGPKAQEILAEFPTEDPEDYIFSPAKMTEERRIVVRASRKTAVQPSQFFRATRRPKKKPGQKYSPRSYHQAVRKACIRADVSPWAPNQLRHTRGTEVRQRYGLEAAQVILGHAQARITEIYAETSDALAARVASETG